VRFLERLGSAPSRVGLAVLLTAVLTGCGDDTPTVPTKPIPTIAGRYEGYQLWQTQFVRVSDGYNGSWTCPGQLTIVHAENSTAFTGFAVVEAPCRAESFEVTGTVTSAGAITFTTAAPRAGAGPCPAPPSFAYSGLARGQTLSAQGSVTVTCGAEGDYRFTEIVDAYKYN